jgi:predicted small lipoprotein YifL
MSFARFTIVMATLMLLTSCGCGKKTPPVPVPDAVKPLVAKGIVDAKPLELEVEDVNGDEGIDEKGQVTKCNV